ncbi:MAG: outer membrane lipoprotein carrier protein LolA [Halothiobacillus sp. 20-54-6]|nr:MAG: outer membrane lipoprotein carrier protein LolA [Halothiobacillus sp. 20-54-6]
MADTQVFPLGADTVESDVRPLTEFVKNLKTFSADFVQKQVNVRGQTQPGSTGNFVLSRPGQFYWAYEKPYVQKLIASAGILWVYDPDLAQVTQSPLAENRGAPIGIFLGNQPLEKVFALSSIGSNDGLSWYSLSDRTQQSDFSQVQIGMDAKGIKAMVFTDKLGNRTTVQFSARAVNQRVDDALFKFTPPAGVDVVNSR